MTTQSPKFQPRAGKGRSPKATICLEYNKTVNQDYSKFIDDMIEKKSSAGRQELGNPS